MPLAKITAQVDLNITVGVGIVAPAGDGKGR